MIFVCKRVELAKFESGQLEASAALIANEGREDRQIITITGPGIKFLPGNEYDINVLVDGQDWQTLPDNDPKELGYTGD